MKKSLILHSLLHFRIKALSKADNIALECCLYTPTTISLLLQNTTYIFHLLNNLSEIPYTLQHACGNF